MVLDESDESDDDASDYLTPPAGFKKAGAVDSAPMYDYAGNVPQPEPDSAPMYEYAGNVAQPEPEPEPVPKAAPQVSVLCSAPPPQPVATLVRGMRADLSLPFALSATPR